MKLLTVTVPCYNSQDYMEKCIQSLLPGGNRVEIIIIDDGSKDNTGKIADEYARKFPDIVGSFIRKTAATVRGINQGLKHATGTYFKVVDSDDTLSPDFPKFLDALEECERQGGVDMVVTNYYYVHSDGDGDRSINYSCRVARRTISSHGRIPNPSGHTRCSPSIPALSAPRSCVNGSSRFPNMFSTRTT